MKKQTLVSNLDVSQSVRKPTDFLPPDRPGFLAQTGLSAHVT